MLHVIITEQSFNWWITKQSKSVLSHPGGAVAVSKQLVQHWSYHQWGNLIVGLVFLSMRPSVCLFGPISQQPLVGIYSSWARLWLVTWDWFLFLSKCEHLKFHRIRAVILSYREQYSVESLNFLKTQSFMNWAAQTHFCCIYIILGARSILKIMVINPTIHMGWSFTTVILFHQTVVVNGVICQLVKWWMIVVFQVRPN